MFCCMQTLCSCMSFLVLFYGVCGIIETNVWGDNFEISILVFLVFCCDVPCYFLTVTFLVARCVEKRHLKFDLEEKL